MSFSKGLLEFSEDKFIDLSIRVKMFGDIPDNEPEKWTTTDFWATAKEDPWLWDNLRMIHSEFELSLTLAASQLLAGWPEKECREACKLLKAKAGAQEVIGLGTLRLILFDPIHWADCEL